MRQRVSYALLAVLACPGLCLADETSPGIVQIASRLFLAPDLPRRYADGTDFLPLTEMDWVSRIVRADPVLDGVVLHVERPMTPPAPGLGPEGRVRTMNDTASVPERFRAEDLLSTTRPDVANPKRFLYRPDVSEADYEVVCAIDPTYSEELFQLCVLRATYPLDPAILLKARYYFPPEPLVVLQHRFEAMVDRMREIALCLDVTEAPPADPEEALEALLDAIPSLEGCEDKLSS